RQIERLDKGHYLEIRAQYSKSTKSAGERADSRTHVISIPTELRMSISRFLVREFRAGRPARWLFPMCRPAQVPSLSIQPVLGQLAHSKKSRIRLDKLVDEVPYSFRKILQSAIKIVGVADPIDIREIALYAGAAKVIQKRIAEQKKRRQFGRAMTRPRAIGPFKCASWAIIEAPLRPGTGPVEDDLRDVNQLSGRPQQRHEARLAADA